MRRQRPGTPRAGVGRALATMRPAATASLRPLAFMKSARLLTRLLNGLALSAALLPAPAPGAGPAASRRRPRAARGQRLRPADDGPACPGAAVPHAGRLPDLRRAGQPRRQVQARAGAGRVVADDVADQLALQAAARASSSTTAARSPPTTPCSRSSARWRAPSQRAFQLKGVTGVSQDRPADDRDPARGARCRAARKAGLHLDDEQGLVREERRRQRAQDFNGKQETFAVRNANGTGPFRLERYEPDVRTTLQRATPATGAGRPTSAAATCSRSATSRSSPTPRGWRR